VFVIIHFLDVSSAPAPAAKPATSSKHAPDKKRRSVATSKEEDSDSDGNEQTKAVDSSNEMGIGPHFTEEYRQSIPFGKYKDTKFAEDPDALEECARLIVEDMTHRFNLGLVIPPDAPHDFNG
jgi:hypothetical protein